MYSHRRHVGALEQTLSWVVLCVACGGASTQPGAVGGRLRCGKRCQLLCVVCAPASPLPAACITSCGTAARQRAPAQGLVVTELPSGESMHVFWCASISCCTCTTRTTCPGMAGINQDGIGLEAKTLLISCCFVLENWP